LPFGKTGWTLYAEGGEGRDKKYYLAINTNGGAYLISGKKAEDDLSKTGKILAFYEDPGQRQKGKIDQRSGELRFAAIDRSQKVNGLEH